VLVKCQDILAAVLVGEECKSTASHTATDNFQSHEDLPLFLPVHELFSNLLLYLTETFSSDWDCSQAAHLGRTSGSPFLKAEIMLAAPFLRAAASRPFAIPNSPSNTSPWVGETAWKETEGGQ
jgi:hypothetical protein